MLHAAYLIAIGIFCFILTVVGIIFTTISFANNKSTIHDLLYIKKYIP